MSPAAKIHAILLPLVAAAAASLAGAVWARGRELRFLLAELAVLFILFPAAFYSMIYFIRFKWWIRNQRGVCGSCGRPGALMNRPADPSSRGIGSLSADGLRRIIGRGVRGRFARPLRPIARR